MDVQQQGARGIGGVGGVNRSAGQFPDEPGVYGARQQAASLGRISRAGRVVQDPGHLGGRKIGVEQQARRRRDLGLQPLILQPAADLRGAPVLPDNGPVDRAAVRLVPHHRGLALITQAQGREMTQWAPARLHGLAQHGDAGLPYLVGVVLDPAVGGIKLLQWTGGLGQNIARRREHHGPRAGGSLVKRQQEAVGHGSVPLRKAVQAF